MEEVQEWFKAEPKTLSDGIQKLLERLSKCMSRVI